MVKPPSELAQNRRQLESDLTYDLLRPWEEGPRRKHGRQGAISGNVGERNHPCRRLRLLPPGRTLRFRDRFPNVAGANEPALIRGKEGIPRTAEIRRVPW
jgi:hypothetical protein